MMTSHTRFDGCGRPRCTYTRIFADPYERFPFDDYYRRPAYRVDRYYY